MRRIFAIGETVFDIIFKDNKPVSATPGGSMLNTAVSLGRLGVEVYFISEYGEDRVGEIVNNFLQDNGVNPRYVCRYKNYPSSLALAFLDKDNNASYNFYKRYPEDRLNIVFPELTANDIIVYGSFYGIDARIHDRLKPFLQHACDKNAIIIYDPNFRAAHLPEIEIHRPMMLENFKFADIVKGSDEDFAHIFGVHSASEAWQAIRDMCDVLVYTANKHDVHLYTPQMQESYEVPPMKPISTIGAGDSFSAGLIYGLITQDIYKNDLLSMNQQQRMDIIYMAIMLAGRVCMSYDNYISQDVADEIKRGD